MLKFLFNLVEEVRHALLDSTVGSLAHWVGRVARILFVTFVTTGVAAVGGGVGVVYINDHTLPTQTSWVVIGAVAVVLTLLVTGAVGVWCVARGALYVLRHPFDHLTRRPGSGGAGSSRSRRSGPSEGSSGSWRVPPRERVGATSDTHDGS